MTSAPRRAGALLAALLVAFVGVGMRLGYLQTVQSKDYVETARRQRVRRIDLPASRGVIYDRRGGELAISVPARTIYANPKQVTDPAGEAKVLSPLIGRDATTRRSWRRPAVSPRTLARCAAPRPPTGGRHLS